MKLSEELSRDHSEGHHVSPEDLRYYAQRAKFLEDQIDILVNSNAERMVAVIRKIVREEIEDALGNI